MLLLSAISPDMLLRLIINLMVVVIFIMPTMIGIRKLIGYLRSEEVLAKLVEIKFHDENEPDDDPDTVAVYEYEKNGETFRVNSDWLEFDKELRLRVYQGRVYKLQNVVMYLLIVLLAAIVFFVLVNVVFLGKYATEVRVLCLKLIPVVFSIVVFLGGFQDMFAYVRGQTVDAKIVDIKGKKPENGKKELIYPIYEYELLDESYRIEAEHPVYATNTDFIGKEKKIRIYNGRVIEPVRIFLYIGVSVMVGGVLYLIISLLT